MAPSRTTALEALMRSRRATAAAVTVAFVVSAAQLAAMIRQHAVNVLFSDQWDFLQPLRRHENLWQLFSLQHGPHRMGLGYLFIDAVYSASAWDNRAEAWATFALYVLVVAIALLLKRRATGALTPLDAAIPILVLSRTQYEIFIGPPNAAHGPIPLLLAVAAPFCWEIDNRPVRTAVLALLAFCAAFTGFAILFVPCLAALLAAEALEPREPRDPAWSAVGIVLCGAAVAAFLRGYRFDSAVACFQFPDSHPLRYLPFAGLVEARIVRVGHLIPGAVLLGTILGLLGIALVAHAAARVLHRGRTLLDRAVFLWSSFGLAFAAHAAVGRLCLGMEAAFSTRYVPYEIPLWLAAYLTVARWVVKRPTLRAPVAAGVVALAALQWSLSNSRADLRWFSEGKAQWKSCYLATRDATKCNAVFRVYPVDGSPKITRMLDYLAEHHLNLFKP